MTYAEALAILLADHSARIARNGWNAGGQHIFVVPAENGRQPCLGIKNAQGLYQPGWVASQGDTFATDWYVL